jgi:hypothetical protein
VLSPESTEWKVAKDRYDAILYSEAAMLVDQDVGHAMWEFKNNWIEKRESGADTDRRHGNVESFKPCTDNQNRNSKILVVRPSEFRRRAAASCGSREQIVGLFERSGAISKAVMASNLPHLLRESYLDRRLIGNIALVGGDLDLLKAADGPV